MNDANQIMVEEPRGFARYTVGLVAEYFLFGADFESKPNLLGDFIVEKIVVMFNTVKVYFKNDGSLEVPKSKTYYIKMDKEE
jgi:hypothetical protein